MYLYSVKDVKSGIFASPFVSENEETASRALTTTLMTQSDSLLKLYPDDYILYEIGYFDNETGWIEHSELKRIVSCAEIISQQVNKLELKNADNTVIRFNKSDREESK